MYIPGAPALQGRRKLSKANLPVMYSAGHWGERWLHGWWEVTGDVLNVGWLVKKPAGQPPLGGKVQLARARKRWVVAEQDLVKRPQPESCLVYDSRKSVATWFGELSGRKRRWRTRRRLVNGNSSAGKTGIK